MIETPKTEGRAGEKAEIPLEMYEIPGQDAITEHSLQRYLKDKEQDAAIAKAAMQFEAIEKDVVNIEKLPEEKRRSTLEAGLASPDINTEAKAVARIKFAPEAERGDLLDKAFGKIAENFDNPNMGRKLEAIGLANLLTEEHRALMRKKILNEIKAGLKSADFEEEKRAVWLIRYAPGAEQPALQEKAKESFWAALRSEDNTRKKEAVHMLEHFPPEKEGYFLIEKLFNHSDPLIRTEAMKMIRRLPPYKLDPLIEKGLADADPEIRKIAARMMKYGSTHLREEVFIKTIADKELGNEVVKSVLYDKVEFGEERISRKDFTKTGSGTTLLGGDLKEKSIIRHITPSAFLEWQKLYEDHELWKQNGFDYVPIEPIQAYTLNKDGLVDAYSAILDLDLGKWEDMTKKYESELNKARYKILEVLDKAKVKHNHSHISNFCLRFFRDKEGKIDFEKAPRLYLIDLDLAVSLEAAGE